MPEESTIGDSKLPFFIDSGLKSGPKHAKRMKNWRLESAFFIDSGLKSGPKHAKRMKNWRLESAFFIDTGLKSGPKHVERIDKLDLVENVVITRGF